jgi:hypothetical protein
VNSSIDSRIRVRGGGTILGVGGVMSVEIRDYYQICSACDRFQLNRAVVIHTFGGRGSPVESRLAA